jgi:hypothetical protein
MYNNKFVIKHKIYQHIYIRDARSSVITDHNRFFTSSVTIQFQSKTDRLTDGFIYKKTDKKTNTAN